MAVSWTSNLNEYSANWRVTELLSKSFVTNIKRRLTLSLMIRIKLSLHKDKKKAGTLF